jgi:hypothetical protein
LAHYWGTFQPEDPKEVVIRLRSAPWDDILDDDLTTTDELASVDGDKQQDDPALDSPQVNIIQKPPPPTWYASVAVSPATTQERLPASDVQQMLTVHLPPPHGYTPVFVRTPETTLMTQVIEDLLDHDLLRPDPRIVNAIRVFLIAK